ncbi:peptidoglycan binding protein CsiV [Halorhodospira halochloris]|uniref:CsiV family protein n=1 Tax=Halorhodospira halochloris TaxID=1052 RepID=UPI001EE8BE34|nr:peptidoglycan binding protein CsiV [Halorhodospira halochloris]
MKLRGIPQLPYALIWCLLTMAMLSSVSWADSDANADEQEQEQEQWHEIEVLIFRQWERGGRHAERWPTRAADPHYPLWQIPAGCEGEHGGSPTPLGSELEVDPEQEIDDFAPDDAQDANEDGEQEQQPTFVCLPEQSRELGDEWANIARSGDYQQLYYAAWAQPKLNEARSIAVPVPYHWHPQPEQQLIAVENERPLPQEPVYGLIRVFKERFVHAVVDLRMHRSASGAEVDEQEWLRAPLHVMHQSRRMREGDLHYLDHPTLGVLIVVREVDGPP